MPVLSKAVLAAYLGGATSDVVLTAQAYTTIAGDNGNLLQVTAGVTTATVTLLSAVTAGDGATLAFIKADSGAGRVVINDGADRAWLSAQNDFAVFRSNGTTWDALGWGIAQLKNVFTVTGTYTRPPLARSVRVMAFGQGGPGSSGQRRAAAAIRTGGGPGGPGAVVEMSFRALALSSTVTVTIPTDNAGGAAVSVNDTVGTAGTQGGATTFGSYISAVAGLPGGSAALGAAQAGGGSQLTQSNIGIPNAGSSSATTTSTPATAANGQAGAGAPGAGATAANVIAPTTAGPGGSCYSVTPTSGGTISSAGNPGGNGADITDTDSQMGGGGGGGGWWATSTAGTAGGVGGAPAGGGGGGGASDNGTNSGAGGNGGRGEVRVWTNFE